MNKKELSDEMLHKLSQLQREPASCEQEKESSSGPKDIGGDEEKSSAMSSYIGTKIVKAEPMPEHDFLRHIKGMSIDDINKRETQGEGYVVVYEDGYTSWSPKETFERAYRKITNQEKNLIK